MNLSVIAFKERSNGRTVVQMSACIRGMPQPQYDRVSYIGPVDARETTRSSSRYIRQSYKVPLLAAVVDALKRNKASE